MAARAKKTSSPPLSLKSLRFDLERPPPGFYRADIEFYGVDHSGASLEARVFIDNADANASTALEAGQGYVDSFYIFGHGGCFGDVGHCDVPVRDDPFDLRSPHQLTPAARTVTVTNAIKRLLDAGTKETTVTVVAHTAEDAPDNVLGFDKIRLATYA